MVTPQDRPRRLNLSLPLPDLRKALQSLRRLSRRTTVAGTVAGILVAVFAITGVNLVFTANLVNSTRHRFAQQLVISRKQEDEAVARAIAAARVLEDHAARRAIRANNHKWCDALNIIDRAEKHTPPTTKTGRRLFAAFRKLHRQYGC